MAPKVTVCPLAGLTFAGRKWSDSGSYIHADSDGEWTETEYDAPGSSTLTCAGMNTGGGPGCQLTDGITAGPELKDNVVSDFDQFIPGIHVVYNF